MNSPKTYQALAKTAHNRLRNELARLSIVEPALENLDPQHASLWEYGLSHAVCNPGASPEQIHATVAKYDVQIASRRGVPPVMGQDFKTLKDHDRLRFEIMREAADVFGADVLAASTEQEIDGLPEGKTRGTAFEIPRDPVEPTPHTTFQPLGDFESVQASLDAEDPEFREGQALSDAGEPLRQDASEAKQRGFYSRKTVEAQEGAVAVSS